MIKNAKMNRLLIRHLPDFFTHEDTVNFLKSFGSIDVNTFDKKGKMVCILINYVIQISISLSLIFYALCKNRNTVHLQHSQANQLL